jgi:hypothetical protein
MLDWIVDVVDVAREICIVANRMHVTNLAFDSADGSAERVGNGEVAVAHATEIRTRRRNDRTGAFDRRVR